MLISGDRPSAWAAVRWAAMSHASMQFPERHPELALYWSLGWALVALGLIWIGVGVLSHQHAAPVASGATSVAPWQLAWWARFGWAYGLFLSIFGVGVIVYRGLNKRRILFGDRIRREYK